MKEDCASGGRMRYYHTTLRRLLLTKSDGGIDEVYVIDEALKIVGKPDVEVFKSIPRMLSLAPL